MTVKFLVFVEVLLLILGASVPTARPNYVLCFGVIMDIRMDKKTAIITGGSAGIGKAIAQNFILSGANVVIAARRQPNLEKAVSDIVAASKTVPDCQTKIKAISADIRSADECAKLVAFAHSEYGGIDILINNAGTSQRGDFLEVSDELWQDDLDLKLFAAIRLSRLVILKCAAENGAVLSMC